MSASRTLDRGRQGFHDRSWQRASDLLAAEDVRSGLAAEDLELLATSAYLSGHDRESTDAWARAHRAWLGRGEPVRASRTASARSIGTARRSALHDINHDALARRSCGVYVNCTSDYSRERVRQAAYGPDTWRRLGGSRLGLRLPGTVSGGRP